jgi:hypothetical protein
MTDWDLVLLKLGLDADAAAATAFLLEEGGSTKADTYLAARNYTNRLELWKAAQS